MTTAMNRLRLEGLLAFDDGAEHVMMQIACEASEVGSARYFAREQLARWGFSEESFSDRVVLTVSELVTNAVLHARTRMPGESELIELKLVFHVGQALVVLVTDNSRKMPPVGVPPSAEATTGRGLLLVNALADSWTVVPEHGLGARRGKVVCAFFRCHMSADLPAPIGVMGMCDS
ncbi:ATP-binding protein [Streptomyces sp. ME02-6987-2C]|uniref:ATP-binding protein n=1 Tax=unclassified Streptomyces TaxID=2593676 RepID=UPI00087B0597|nr:MULTISPECIES: ATP-binding protein [unclassified Streptomyces]MDX3367416.1 ATP-binding protein [Streptomyces sp. ME02-6987-2C]MDX3423768.1 ATP-binding protein [Streptomyces sp. ME02-6985-2c]REH20667.1 anti-sigma regulatory factor (Ser/Thr protein kinase) [Streptomyces sp. 2221.1]SDT31795.1 Anti-sigma regulatory factor (Ser/Thr protein kinase) [Streptomyces sp. 2114.2]